ncbi:MAG: acyltransferase [Moraxellaceae bacterium]|nr:acyltransferase [Moraxellaceae bacterium]MDZ4387135.1 acyltransferase [Moraxellaceae bacterium]
MFRRFLIAARGALLATLIIGYTLFLAIILIVLSPLKLLSLPIPSFTPPLRAVMNGIQELWTLINGYFFKLCLPKLKWHVEGMAELKRHKWYFVVANHQSWIDILAIYHVLNFRVPVGKFFIKNELLYVPLIGLAVYALDFPFMKRYSKEALTKRPDLRGKDLATTRKACAKYQYYPVTVINFLEGTRITPTKHQHSQSPYQHLLKPKSAGAAFVISALGDRMDCVLDMTIAYPQGIPSFWDFCCGRVQDICIDIKLRPIPEYFCQRNYESDADYRQEFQSWVNAIWQDKDQTMSRLLTLE